MQEMETIWRSNKPGKSWLCGSFAVLEPEILEEPDPNFASIFWTMTKRRCEHQVAGKIKSAKDHKDSTDLTVALVKCTCFACESIRDITWMSCVKVFFWNLGNINIQMTSDFYLTNRVSQTFLQNKEMELLITNQDPISIFQICMKLKRCLQ